MASATFRMPVELLAAVEQIVSAFDVDKSDVFRAALRRFVAAFPADPKEGAALLIEPVQPRGGFPFTSFGADASDPEMTPRTFRSAMAAPPPAEDPSAMTLAAARAMPPQDEDGP